MASACAHRQRCNKTNKQEMKYEPTATMAAVATPTAPAICGAPLEPDALADVEDAVALLESPVDEEIVVVESSDESVVLVVESAAVTELDPVALAAPTVESIAPLPAAPIVAEVAAAPEAAVVAAVVAEATSAPEEAVDVAVVAPVDGATVDVAVVA
ncbi:hypothetical protein BBJ28_00005637 [Nothophytophthora sp. Chile5]|nr:hypothetical protein BBJ28_00005637 [Nothophytophthora sp. Chile5]